MHLIIIIASGVFGGMWLFNWWRERRDEQRRYLEFKRRWIAGLIP